jgi:glycosyltransferase involved in cell wall biosynthesis
MAMALPVVTYPQATAGIDCLPGTHVLFAATPAELVERAVDLLRDPDRGRALGVEARRLMEGHSSWESRAAMFERLYNEVVDGSLRGAGAPVERQRR